MLVAPRYKCAFLDAFEISGVFINLGYWVAASFESRGYRRKKNLNGSDKESKNGYARHAAMSR